MRSLYIAAILGLSVLSLPVSAFAQEEPPRCVKEAYEAPDEEEMEKELKDEERPLHEAGTRLIRNFICNGRESCLRKHGARLEHAAHTVVDVCLEDPDIPRYICLGLVANLANEGGGVEHPSCGSLRKECVLRCDRIWVNGARHDCFKQCAIEQGVARGTHRWKRIYDCNDKGTSRGPFQMKKGRIAQCRKFFGKDFDPFSLPQAARCTARILKRTALSDRWPCGRVGNRWLVAYKRITRGVIRTVAKAEKGRWIPDAHGGRTWIEPRKAVVEQICDESGYGQRGLRYYRACGKKCSLVKYHPPTPPAPGPGKVLTFKESGGGTGAGVERAIRAAP